MVLNYILVGCPWILINIPVSSHRYNMNNEMSLNDGHHYTSWSIKFDFTITAAMLGSISDLFWVVVVVVVVAFRGGSDDGVQHMYSWTNEGLRDWQNLFAITRFRFIVFLFHIFYYYWGRENRSLYRGLRFIEVRGHFTFLGNCPPTRP